MKQASGGRKKEMRLRIDDTTAQRHERLFLDGDYARIVELIGGTATVAAVSAAFSAGNAPASMAKAMKAYYEEKEKMQEELNNA